jgi:hypothetical protein
MQNPAPVDDLLEELTGFATAVAQLPLSSITNWAHRPTPDQWSLTEVMCHLRDVEREIHQVRFRALLSEDGAFIAGAENQARIRSTAMMCRRAILVSFWI